MKTVLVTGASGFIGKNLCSRLEQEKDIKVLCFTKGDSLQSLKTMIDRADFVFHLAGANRPTKEIEFTKTNQDLTAKIISLLKENNKKTPLLLSSSIQAESSNPYGVSKKAAEDIVFAYGADSKAAVYIYRLPGIFGKWCKPNYNSVVATFCHNIASNLPVTVNDPKHEITLGYIDNVIDDFISALQGTVTPNNKGFCALSKTYKTTLQSLKDDIMLFNKSRIDLTMPNFEKEYSRCLYATFLSYLPKDNFDTTLKTNFDDRGWLAEFIKSKQFGQIFVSKTKPGITRGNHWHHTKIEKFLVVDGQAEVIFRLVGGDEVIHYPVSGDKLKVIDIPAGYTHAIKNIGDRDLITIFWSDEIFNPDKPDTIFLKVEKEETSS